MNCNNCGSTYTCSCKVRTASDGKKVCVNCVNKYNEELEKKSKEKNNIPPA